MSWPIAALTLLGLLVLGAVIGLARSRAVRRLLLAVAIVLALVAFVPVRCATAGPDTEVGADAGQLGGQSFCETAYGWRLPEVASLDGDGPGYALALAGAALVLAGSALAGRRRRGTAVVG